MIPVGGSGGVLPALWLRRLRLRDFRCHRRLEQEFSPGINLICGANGSGKSSLLEAVHLMVCGVSFRRSRVRDLLRWGAQRYQVRGHWQRFGVLHVTVEGDRLRTMIALQGRALARRSDLQEQLALVADSPQGDPLVDGDPRARRRWLDRLVMAVAPQVAPCYHHYYRALLQRSRLVRQQQGGGAGLAAWNVQMVRAGRRWMEVRAAVVARINRLLADEAWVGAPLVVRLRESAPPEDGTWLELLETAARPLRVGPHCDAIALQRGGREVRTCGSHGQQRVAAVALRLAESALRAEQRGIQPLMMLDDCFTALDRSWRIRLTDRLAAYPGQVLLTAPDDALCADVLPKDASILRLDAEACRTKDGTDG
ncbi:MAG: DNA replication and repair protein RecF [Zetaproteobacteria bacterium]|nr:MAG: DNA replication and repair protein RecF [Zetaproteobacteria bacterium]